MPAVSSTAILRVQWDAARRVPCTDSIRTQGGRRRLAAKGERVEVRLAVVVIFVFGALQPIND